MYSPHPVQMGTQAPGEDEVGEIFDQGDTRVYVCFVPSTILTLQDIKTKTIKIIQIKCLGILELSLQHSW